MYSCGRYHTVAILENENIRKVYSCGSNVNGQLGQPNHVTNLDKFTLVPGLEDIYPIMVVATDYFTVVLDDKGDIYGWGWNRFAVFHGENNGRHLAHKILSHDKLPGIKFIAADDFRLLFITNDGKVYISGNFRFGSGVFRVNGLNNIVDASVDYNIIALDEDGNIWKWDVGHPDKNVKHVRMPNNLRGIKIFHSRLTRKIILLEDGRLVRLNKRKPKIIERVPKIIKTFPRIITINTTSYDLCAIDESGKIHIRPSVDFDTIDSNAHDIIIDASFLNLYDVQIDGSKESFIVKDGDGHLWAWGKNTDGILGIGNVAETHSLMMIDEINTPAARRIMIKNAQVL